MQKELFHYIASELLKTPILSYSFLSGDNVSSVYLLTCRKEKFVLKTQESRAAKALLKAEKKGLQYIAKTKTIKTPSIFFLAEFNGTSFLLMEFIESKVPHSNDYKKLGIQLARLHQSMALNLDNYMYGFETSNYIGNLHQSNTMNKDWTLFYLHERLLPQLQLAYAKNLLTSDEIPSVSTLVKVCNQLFPNPKPSLLHGDFWNGNFLVATDGTPYIIDPAVYYGHSEIDIAMSRLFSGFSLDFYKAYYNVIPRTPSFEERNDIYQLYYLLVHLNLFGKMYYSPVKKILFRYFIPA